MSAAEAGVRDIPEADYFAATHALSASGMKLLLPPSCPAKFRWAQDHPQKAKRQFELGTAAHRMILGQGAEWVLLDYPDYRTKAAQQARDEARAAGAAPILPHEYQQILAMADAIRAHEKASILFDPAAGLPERSLFWDDPETGVPCRARLDWLPDPRGGRLIIPDYKTTGTGAHPDPFGRSAGDYAYHIQHAHYTAGAAALGLDDDPAFVFVVQEKDPPYLVNVVQLDPGSIRAGRIARQAALEIFRDCTASGEWPGYPADIPDITIPPWKSRIPEGFYT